MPASDARCVSRAEIKTRGGLKSAGGNEPNGPDFAGSLGSGGVLLSRRFRAFHLRRKTQANEFPYPTVSQPEKTVPKERLVR